MGRGGGGLAGVEVTAVCRCGTGQPYRDECVKDLMSAATFDGHPVQEGGSWGAGG